MAMKESLSRRSFVTGTAACWLRACACRLCKQLGVERGERVGFGQHLDIRRICQCQCC